MEEEKGGVGMVEEWRRGRKNGDMNGWKSKGCRSQGNERKIYRDGGK